MNPFQTSREIPASAEQVFAAFSNADRLVRWWGPAGFTNTFERCEFEPGGRWAFIMHGPDGRNYRNEILFAEIDASNRIVLQHISEPRYQLTITLSSTPAGSIVSWTQEFEKPEVATGLAHIVRPANEQNLDRLTAEVLRVRGQERA